MTAVGQPLPLATTGPARVPPWRRRLRGDTGGAALLLLATLAALLWANSPWGDTYAAFWDTELSLRLGDRELTLDLQHWVNDGLMTFFFFVVGLEVKRELALGELADRRRAAVPALAALAGLAVPALVYVLFNLGGAGVAAWGVVISTDTAFLLGVLVLLGSAVPPQLRVFLMALAIGDDVGALLVIAVFYTDDLAVGPLVLALLVLAAMTGLRRLHVWRGPAHLVLAVVAWVLLYLSGVHATLLGVAIALLTPAYAARREEVADAARRARAYAQSPDSSSAHRARLSIERSVPPGERLQRLWQPWTGMVIVPLFALANAGVPLTAQTLGAAATSTITLGIVAGLVLGKLVGIVAGTGLAVRVGLGELAPGISRLGLAGGAALSGIGFTISLFIVDLAFDDQALADQARVGVLAASVVAAGLGWGLIRLSERRRPAGTGERPELLDPPVDPEHDHVRGPVEAPLTLVEYGDFDCPFCGRATGAVEEVRELFGDDLRYVFRHSPLVETHIHAQLAAEASEAAGSQGRFWEMFDRLFAARGRLTTPDLMQYAEDTGLDVRRFAHDLGTADLARRVRADLVSAEASGVTGVPTFFVNGRRHEGPHDAATLVVALGGPPTRQAPPVDAVAESRSPGADRERPALPTLPADLPETPDRDGAFPRLSDEHITLLAAAGARRRVDPGDVLYRAGDPDYQFVVVLSGAVAVVEDTEDTDAAGDLRISVHGERRFLGETDMWRGGSPARSAVAVRAGEVLIVPADRGRQVLGANADLRETVVRAFLLRHGR